MIQWFQGPFNNSPILHARVKRGCGSEWGVMDQGGQKQTDSDPFTCHDRFEISPNQSFLVKKKKR